MYPWETLELLEQLEQFDLAREAPIYLAEHTKPPPCFSVLCSNIPQRQLRGHPAAATDVKVGKEQITIRECGIMSSSLHTTE